MKKFSSLLFGLALLTGCGSDHRDELHYDVTCVVVQVDRPETLTNDKFHQPTRVPLRLLRSLRDTTQYMEQQVSPEVYYNTRVGDTVHWDYVRKDRFFVIHRRPQ